MQISHVNFPAMKEKFKSSFTSTKGMGRKTSSKLSIGCADLCVFEICVRDTHNGSGICPNLSLYGKSHWLRKARSPKTTNKCTMGELASHLSYTPYLVRKMKICIKHSCYLFFCTLLLPISCLSHVFALPLSRLPSVVVPS